MSKTKKKGLGKGMGSLIEGYSLEDVFFKNPNNKNDLNPETDLVLLLSLSKIKANKNQPRKTFEEKALNELAQSIKNQGVLQPILVEEVEDNMFSIVAGERRFRAAKIAGLLKIPAIVKKFTDVSRLEVALIENIQRENLNPIEEAVAYSFLIKQKQITQEELATKLGKSRSAISNSIRLLQLPKTMQDGLVEGIYSSGHARAILSLVNPADRTILLEKLKNSDMSVRETEKIAKELNKGNRNVISNKKAGKKAQDDYNEISEIREKFIEVLGNKVEIKGDMFKGKVILSYDNEKELEKLFQKLSNGKDLFEI